MDDSLAIRWRDLPPRAELQALWSDVEARADASFFLTWAWISTWLDVLPRERQPRLLEATRAGRAVGLGLLVPAWTRRLRWLPVRCWLLHECGVPTVDTLTIEYNDFLLDRDGAADTRLAMVQAVQRDPRRRLKVSAGVPAFDELSGHVERGSFLPLYSRPSPWVDLLAVRGAPEGFLSLLNSSRRGQIRQGLRAYAELGPVQLTQANDLATARLYLDRLFTLHAQSWAARGQRTEFTGVPMVRRFHETLLTTAFDSGAIQLLRLSAGDTEVAYLYNFVHRGRVNHYQSGMRYALLPRHDRPGYVSHALAIDHNAALGHGCYDFLAGNEAYKQALTGRHETLHWCEVERRSWITALETQLKPAWRRLKHRLKRPPTAPRGAE